MNNIYTLKQIINKLVEECLIEEKVILNNDTIKIEDSYHSRIRKRRDNNEGYPITDKEIIFNINKALPQLIKHYNNGEIPSNNKVWIFNTVTKANIIIEYHVTQVKKNKIKIITVMRVSDFKNSEDTSLKIEI